MYHDYFPNLSIDECLDCLEEDFNLLRDGSWEPDADSCEASLNMVESIRAKLFKKMNLSWNS